MWNICRLSLVALCASSILALDPGATSQADSLESRSLVDPTVEFEEPARPQNPDKRELTVGVSDVPTRWSYIAPKLTFSHRHANSTMKDLTSSMASASAHLARCTAYHT